MDITMSGSEGLAPGTTHRRCRVLSSSECDPGRHGNALLKATPWLLPPSVPTATAPLTSLLAWRLAVGQASLAHLFAIAPGQPVFKLTFRRNRQRGMPSQPTVALHAPPTSAVTGPVVLWALKCRKTVAAAHVSTSAVPHPGGNPKPTVDGEGGERLR